MGAVDTLLEVGAGFDWISPLAGILGDLMNGPGHTFLITIGASPMTGAEIERMLRKRGIKTWGALIVSGTLLISVRLAQARYAQHLLKQAGIPIENPVPGAQGAPRGYGAAYGGAYGRRQGAPRPRGSASQVRTDELRRRREILENHARKRAAVLAKQRRG